MSNNSDFSTALGIPPLLSHSPDTIAALLWTREILQQHLTTTYVVKDPNGIEELKPVNIGGIDQWLHIRGRNRNNPSSAVFTWWAGISQYRFYGRHTAPMGRLLYHCAVGPAANRQKLLPRQ